MRPSGLSGLANSCSPMNENACGPNSEPPKNSSETSRKSVETTASASSSRSVTANTSSAGSLSGGSGESDRRRRLTAARNASASSSPMYWRLASVWPPPAVSIPTVAMPRIRWTSDWLTSTFWARRSGISRSRRLNTPERMSKVSSVSSYSYRR